MKDDHWTVEEKLLNEHFQKMYEEDSCEIPELDKSFMLSNSHRKALRHRRVFQVAAVLMIIILSSAVTAIFITNGYVEAFKSNINKRIFTWNSGVVVTEENNSSEMRETWEITDFGLMPKLQRIIPELRIPEYIPKGYKFDCVVVEQLTNGHYTVTYNYKDKDDELIIVQIPLYEDTNVGGAGKGEIITLSDRDISIWEDFISDLHGCTVFFDDSVVQVSITSVNDNELLEITKELK